MNVSVNDPFVYVSMYVYIQYMMIVSCILTSPSPSNTDHVMITRLGLGSALLKVQGRVMLSPLATSYVGFGISTWMQPTADTSAVKN